MVTDDSDGDSEDVQISLDGEDGQCEEGMLYERSSDPCQVQPDRPTQNLGRRICKVPSVQNPKQVRRSAEQLVCALDKDRQRLFFKTILCQCWGLHRPRAKDLRSEVTEALAPLTAAFLLPSHLPQVRSGKAFLTIIRIPLRGC